MKFLYLTYRNTKMYFKDKVSFFTSLISPLILLFLYVAFLANVYRDSYTETLGGVSDKIMNGLVGGQLLSSLLTVCTVTVAFSCSLMAVSDKTTGARVDILMAPVNDKTAGLAYFASALISAILVNVIATVACFIYLAIVGWYLSFADVILILAYIILLSTFGTALASIINLFLTSQGQIAAVSTVISAGYGFICGAYMPLASYGTTLQNILMLLPSSYTTSLMRGVSLRGVLAELESSGIPQEAISSIREYQDVDLKFFGNAVPSFVPLVVVLCTVALLLGVYLILNASLSKKKN